MLPSLVTRSCWKLLQVWPVKVRLWDWDQRNSSKESRNKESQRGCGHRNQTVRRNGRGVQLSVEPNIWAPGFCSVQAAIQKEELRHRKRGKGAWESEARQERVSRKVGRVVKDLGGSGGFKLAVFRGASLGSLLGKCTLVEHGTVGSNWKWETS